MYSISELWISWLSQLGPQRWKRLHQAMLQAVGSAHTKEYFPTALREVSFLRRALDLQFYADEKNIDGMPDFKEYEGTKKYMRLIKDTGMAVFHHDSKYYPTMEVCAMQLLSNMGITTCRDWQQLNHLHRY